MLHTYSTRRGMLSAPHHLAASTGLAVLREGGNAIEAMVAAAATIAVVYPHMNSIGGDGFWLIHIPGQTPVGIAACGAAGQGASAAFYQDRGYSQIPNRGPLAANTVAGTVSGWGEALRLSGECGGHLPLARLLEDAIHYAQAGVPTTASQVELTAKKLGEMDEATGFAEQFLHHGEPYTVGQTYANPRLAETLRALALEGPDGFYRGQLARRIAADLARVGAPLTLADLAAHRAKRVTPLSVRAAGAQVFNLPPPTQGLASLMILALFDRLGVAEADGFSHIHGVVEATKRAFLVRDAHITDPRHMTRAPATFLSPQKLDTSAATIDKHRAMPWPYQAHKGDTIWMGAIDRDGIAVSFIQSIYWEFGSGVVLHDTGIQWQNRGASFALSQDALQALKPGREPFHTLNPAMALFDDGRVLSYGTMGGEGQPQTQAAIFTRYAQFGQALQQAVSAPRWLLGRTWGAESTSLKIESRLDSTIVDALIQAGHEVEMIEPFTALMGHAGAVARHGDGTLFGASDPRSDGAVAAF